MGCCPAIDCWIPPLVCGGFQVGLVYVVRVGRCLGFVLLSLILIGFEFFWWLFSD